MGLNTALIALDSYYKEGDARELRDRSRKRFGWEEKRTESEMSTLGEQEAARRSGFQTQNAQNHATMELLPAQTQNTKKRQAIEGVGLDGVARRQGDVEATADANASIGKQTSQAQLEQLPQKIRQAKLQGLIDEKGQAEVVIGTLGRMIANNDKAGVLAFANQVAQIGDLLPGTNGMQFTDVQLVKPGEDQEAPNGGYRFVTPKGALKTLPVEMLRDSMSRMASGKYKFIERDDGSIFAGNESTGKGGIVQPGEPGLSKGGKNQHTPAEIQTMDWLISKGVAKSPEEAWNKVRSARGKTRQDFVLDYVSKNAMPGADPNAVAKQAGEIYDNLKKMEGGAGMDGSNSTGAPTLDPRVQSLIGVQ